MRYGLVVVMMVVGFAGVVRADEVEAVKKGVEVFVAAWQAGDAKAMREALVMPTGKDEEFGVVLGAVASVSRLQKVAVEKFGVVAKDYFADAAEQFETRMKAIKDGGIKVTGDSAVLTIEADAAAKTRGGTIVLVKKEGVWRIDAVSLFEVTAELVGASKSLATVADEVTEEIKKGKFAAAADAYQAFQSRFAAAMKAQPKAE
ncbi:MAG: hypothetical protein FWD53_06035 [Phycisphaerales bacterium]|nr:hypothetical protein [Phycisphaerales bacterium]